MTKREVVCPHCSKKKMTIVSSNGQFENLKGGSWYPLVRKVSSGEWSKDWSNGLAIDCKCGRVFFAYGIQDEAAPITVTSQPENETQFVGFCSKCCSAFINIEAICPRCKTQY